MGTVIFKGYVTLGEIGRSAGAFTAGANLRKRPESKEPPKKDPKKGKLDLEHDPAEN